MNVESFSLPFDADFARYGLLYREKYTSVCFELDKLFQNTRINMLVVFQSKNNIILRDQ